MRDETYTYRALETLLVDGKVRAIGVSDFMPGHLDDETITEVAAAHGKTPAQVMLR